MPVFWWSLFFSLTYICPNLQKKLNPNVEAYLEPCQTTKMESFAITVKD